MNDASSRRQRAAGVLLHPTSLPAADGIGDLGAGAYAFVDFLARAGQQIWQVLPLGPTGFGNSPYASRSGLAGNPLLVSLDRLRESGLLDEHDLSDRPAFDRDRVDFDAVAEWKLDRLRRAFGRLPAPEHAAIRQALQTFRADNRGWLPDYALFMAVRQAHGGASWTEWETQIRGREPAALAAAHAELSDEVAFQEFAQFVFAEQWHSLRRYAHERRLRLMGDLPIFVAHDSADVWAHRELFDLDERGEPLVVAGVPPDYFSPVGQRWGNPLYRWDVLAQDGYRWWIERFRALLSIVDMVRIDHFRGFAGYWEIPASAPTAEQGRWMPGPGLALFAAVRAALGDIPLVAEDLGFVTAEVHALRSAIGAPGMRVLQFAFGGDASSAYLPHNYERDTVAYTGTHDNDTSAGWYAAAPEYERAAVREYLARDGSDIAHDLVRAAYESVADLAIVPLQDVLSLGTEARMNVPGEPEANWTWRYRDEALRDDAAAWLASLVRTYGRAARPPGSD